MVPGGGWSRGTRLILSIVVLGFLQAPHCARGAAWPVERQWTEDEERAYSQWFERLASKAWKSADAMLKNPEYNALYEDSDKRLEFYSDCGDLPYVIRAYYSWKRRLPFVGNQVEPRRYGATPNTTISLFDNLSHDGSVQLFLQLCSWNTTSGNFRTAPDADDSFTYPIAINRQTLRPGAVFYSPNGHVALVAEVRNDGTIKLVDAHPDQSVTRISFGPKLEWRSRTYSGGFRWFRTAVVRDGKSVFEPDNAKLPGYSMEQYDLENYYDTLQQRLARMKIDPLRGLETYIREDSYQEALDRVAAVDAGWAIGRRQEIPIGSNIYDDSGDWENFSSPSRDLRLRLSFLHIPDLIGGYVMMLKDDPDSLETQYTSPEALGEALLALKKQLFEELSFQYTNSQGNSVNLTMAGLESRLFDLSFDPNHAPELRWGAKGDELKTATREKKRFYAGYDDQQYWRNRLVKKQGHMEPDDSDNPRETPGHDLTAMIVQAVQDETGAKPRLFVGPPTPIRQPDPQPVAVAKETTDSPIRPASAVEDDNPPPPSAPLKSQSVMDNILLVRKQWDAQVARRNKLMGID